MWFGDEDEFRGRTSWRWQKEAKEVDQVGSRHFGTDDGGNSWGIEGTVWSSSL